MRELWGEHGCKAGDLWDVRVHVKLHEVLGCSGDNLTVTVPVTHHPAWRWARTSKGQYRAARPTVRVKPVFMSGP